MNNEFKILGRESNTITIATFYENYVLGKYNFEPSCQRKSVWDEERESFLIDSIMKNFSIPAIFLYQKIDDNTGKTIYDVIDGKQRLISIIKYIENEIPLPDDFSDDNFGEEELNGLYFKDLIGEKLSLYKKTFWRYNIPVEYIDTEDENIVDTVFDRLNRNGVPLSPQELRNAKFNKTNLLNLVNELTKIEFWKTRFSKAKRMEENEFISELMLVTLENSFFNANPKDIDSLYEKYQDIDNNKANEVRTEFIKITNLLNNMDLDYKKYNIGISHIYAVWCFCLFCDRNNINVLDYTNKVKNLYSEFRSKDRNNEKESIAKYRNSINGGASKSKGRRTQRVQAILDYCNININIQEEFKYNIS